MSGKAKTPAVEQAFQHMPYDIDVEQAILGALQIDNRLIETAAEIIDHDDFYDPLHKRLFQMIVHLQTEGEVNPVILHSVMKTDPGLIEVGGQKYLATLAFAAPSMPNIRDYAKTVRDLSQRRQIIAIGEELVNGAYEAPENFPTGVLAEKISESLSELLSGTGSFRNRRAVAAHEAVSSLMKEIEEQATKDRPIAITTGLPKLDAILGGWLPGKFYIAGARPGMGKTICGTNWARAAAQAGFMADYYSGEVDRQELGARLGCDMDFDTAVAEKLKPLAYQDFVQLRATGGQAERMALANRKLQDLLIDIFDVGRLTIEWIEATARRRARMVPGRRLIIIDHLQLVYSDSVRRNATRTEEMSNITGRLKSLAKETGASIIGLSQLSRDIESQGRDDRRPRQADFRDGGSIEQDADVLMGLMRPFRYAQQKIRAAKNEEQRLTAIGEADAAVGVLEIGILKQRAGPEADYFPLFIDERASALRNEKPGMVEEPDLFFTGGKMF